MPLDSVHPEHGRYRAGEDSALQCPSWKGWIAGVTRQLGARIIWGHLY